MAATRRDPSRKLVWFHAPSVGEGLQARPIIDLLRAAKPDVQIAYTYFSPSAETFAAGLNVDMAGYLPFDSLGDMRRLLDILQPSALMFVKLDVWPNLVRAAAERGVTTGLLSGTMAPRSGRQSSAAQLLLRDAYSALSAVGVIDDDDAERLVAIGVRREIISVTGDTRFDQVWTRAQHVGRNSAVLRALDSPRRKIVAGSTWPSDERVLFGAWAETSRRFPDVQLVLAPHEPTEQHIAGVMTACQQHGLSVALLSRLLRAKLRTDTALASPREASSAGSAKFSDANADVVIIDSVGVLGDVYALADVAFVGGGFHSAGLHSVLEPAAFGAPVVFGPGCDMSREARMLVAQHGGRAVANSDELAGALGNWLGNEMERAAWGTRALGLVRSGLGAAERSLQIVTAALER